MIRAVVTDEQGIELYSAEFADFTDAATWIDGVMKADDSAAYVFTEAGGREAGGSKAQPSGEVAK